MLFLLRYMASGRTGLTFKFVPLQSRLFLDILKVGIPTAVNAVLTNLTVILVTAAVGLFGTTALAAYGIASRLDYVMIPILFGLCTAVLTMVGVNIGAGPERPRQKDRLDQQRGWPRAHGIDRPGRRDRSRCCGCICSATIRKCCG